MLSISEIFIRLGVKSFLFIPFPRYLVEFIDQFCGSLTDKPHKVHSPKGKSTNYVQRLLKKRRKSLGQKIKAASISTGFRYLPYCPLPEYMMLVSHHPLHYVLPNAMTWPIYSVVWPKSMRSIDIEVPAIGGSPSKTSRPHHLYNGGERL